MTPIHDQAEALRELADACRDVSPAPTRSSAARVWARIAPRVEDALKERDRDDRQAAHAGAGVPPLCHEHSRLLDALDSSQLSRRTARGYSHRADRASALFHGRSGPLNSSR